ncbi:MAG: GTPase Der [Phycisphaerae bacterium]
MGKSSLMNMLARAKVSIVDPTPGVTRDRVTAIVHLDPPENKGKPIIAEVVDTGGFGAYVAEGERFDDVGEDLTSLAGDIEFQIAQATESADLVLFAVDAQAGVTALDEEIARKLRERRLGKSSKTRGRATKTKSGGKSAGAESKKPGRAAATETASPPPPIQIVATKTDSQRWEAHALEVSALGLGEPWIVSAKNNYMRREFLDQLYEKLRDIQKQHRKRGEDEGHAVDPKDALPELKLAIIGKRNAGKSTLVNTLAGEPRMIVSEIAGTTRDSVDVRFEYEGKVLVAIDTAGLRRKRSFANQIEWFAFDRLQLSVDRADVVMVLIDATEKISQVDEQVAMLAQKAYKPTIIVVNKWDLVEGRRGPDGKPVTTGRYEEYLRRELKGLWYAPISFISGQSGLNVKETVELAFDLHQQASARVTTGKLNRLIARILETSGPTDKIGTQAKVYFVAQTGTNPPTISMVVNKPELFTPNYQRFLLNRFREELPFAEVPMKLNIRPRSVRAAPGEGPIAAAGVRMKRPVTVEGAPADNLGADDYFSEFDEPADAPEVEATDEAPRRRGKARPPEPDVVPRGKAKKNAAARTEQAADEADGDAPFDDDIDADAFFADMEKDGMGGDVDDDHALDDEE